MIAGLFTLPLAPADAPDMRVRAPAQEVDRGTSASPCGPSGDFIAGPENALVRELAAAAVSGPPVCNPLVLYGASGSGKTALAHALAARRRAQQQDAKVVATTGGDLVGALAHAIDSAGADDFRARHQQCDVLVIDDVQQLQGKPAAQQFLLAAIDSVMARGGLVIATLRQLPQATVGLSPALASRLAGGLVAPLALPGALARRELVRQAASRAGLFLTAAALDELAAQVGSKARLASPRQLCHAVLQVAAGSSAPEVVDSAPDAKSVGLQAIAVVAKHFELTSAELRGKSRRQSIAEARGLAMFLARRLGGASYAEIGRLFGKRDHTTVLHACRKVAGLVASDEATRRLIVDLESQIAAECPA